MKTANIFEKGHNNKGWDKIEKWIENEDVCVNDLLALVCTKFRNATIGQENAETTTKLMVAGDLYTINIVKSKGL